MDKKYLQLFIEITKSMTILSERVMDYNYNKKDKKGEETAQIMRNDYQALYDRISQTDFDTATLKRADYAKLLVGAFVITQNIEDQVKEKQKAIDGYKIDLIPKLDRIVNESNTIEETKQLAEELFQIIDEDK